MGSEAKETVPSLSPPRHHPWVQILTSGFCKDRIRKNIIKVSKRDTAFLYKSGTLHLPFQPELSQFNAFLSCEHDSSMILVGTVIRMSTFKLIRLEWLPDTRSGDQKPSGQRKETAPTGHTSSRQPIFECESPEIILKCDILKYFFKLWLRVPSLTETYLL